MPIYKTHICLHTSKTSSPVTNFKYLYKSFMTFFRSLIPNFQAVTVSEILQNY
ncbi:Uncharacterized protein dnm_096600 [Desulfonema magnum]|uniref:Uncharacterized protein n=1 Tax=Desulfonema magnum TaxID=45655 RepID=A0A975BYI4_9BACT|nr:Uncharacterized protein dnm_096600 [Desulfonema magnum]